MSDRSSKLKLLEDPEFMAMSRARDRICLVLTLLTLIVYYGFIFLLAFGKGIFARTITPNITWGIPIGIGVIVASWVLTGLYVRWANADYDRMVANLRIKAENSHGRPADAH